jgi:hypothetical protein
VEESLVTGTVVTDITVPSEAAVSEAALVEGGPGFAPVSSVQIPASGTPENGNNSDTTGTTNPNGLFTAPAEVSEQRQRRNAVKYRKS